MSMFIFLLLFTTIVSANNIFDVIDYGAIGDGHADDTQAFRSAWEDTCRCSSSSFPPTMYIPSGKTFVLSPSTFKGPCKAKTVQVVINGTVVPPNDINKWKCNGNKICEEWIKFSGTDGLVLTGSGKIDGQGSKWWKDSMCRQSHNGCIKRPIAIKIGDSNNVNISSLRIVNSPRVHILILKCTWVTASNLQISAPHNSPNTDGIDIQRSTNVFLSQLHIGTGDDCIAIGSGSSHIHVDHVNCGPGHGISIGSLGKNGQEGTVEHVEVRNIKFRGSSNGARIKTWQGGKGYVRDILFEHIRCTGVQHPITIDQYYCDPHKICRNQTSAVKISNVRFNHIYGTATKDPAVKLACSETVPCTDIFLREIMIHSANRHHRNKATCHCSSVRGRAWGDIVPSIPCLEKY